MLPYFKIFDLVIFTYPLLMGMAWGVSFNFFHFLLKKEKINFKKRNIYFGGVFLSSWLGAKLFFIITTQGISGSQYALSSNFWLGGGFVFYGGLIGALLFSLIFQGITQQDLRNYNVLVPIVGLGHAVGRIGCLLAGCCYGRPSSLWGTIHIHDEDRLPVQLYEALGLLVIAIISLQLLRKKNTVLVPFYFLSYGVLRFVMETLRGDDIRGIWLSGFSTSQIISSVFVVTSVLWLKNKGWGKVS